MESKPGQAYTILKKMGAQPGDCIDANTFTLPLHESESLSELQSAEKISKDLEHNWHSAGICQ